MTGLRGRLWLLCGFNEVHSGEARPGAERKKKQAQELAVLGPKLALLLTGCELKTRCLLPPLSRSLIC